MHTGNTSHHSPSHPLAVPWPRSKRLFHCRFSFEEHFIASRITHHPSRITHHGPFGAIVVATLIFVVATVIALRPKLNRNLVSALLLVGGLLRRCGNLLDRGLRSEDEAVASRRGHCQRRPADIGGVDLRPGQLHGGGDCNATATGAQVQDAPYPPRLGPRAKFVQDKFGQRRPRHQPKPPKPLRPTRRGHC